MDKPKVQQFASRMVRYSDAKAHQRPAVCPPDDDDDDPDSLSQLTPATESRSVDSAAGPNGSQAMAEFIGSAVPNGVASFINVGHSAALGSIGDVTGFGQDQQFTAVQMLFGSYEAAEPITRLGLNGSYAFGYSAAAMTGAGSVPGLGMLAKHT
ncbi:hypothetical protein D1007_25083 [Hordeum vulgare]|nr:hypothetical protein D1007_25083 [Hordeum vulgare]KAI4972164.1 hypothetical protein ZWY2020_003089 [Hordeum vulgare]